LLGNTPLHTVRPTYTAIIVTETALYHCVPCVRRRRQTLSVLELRISIDRVNSKPVNEDDDDVCLSSVSSIVAVCFRISPIHRHDTTRHDTPMTGDASLTQSLPDFFQSVSELEQRCRSWL